MPLINCEINMILTWSANQNAIFAITNTRLYIPVVTLSTQENAKLLQQLKSGFKREQIFIKTRIISTKSKPRPFS